MILLKGSARVSAQPVDCYTAPLKLVPFGSEAFTYKRALTPFPHFRRFNSPRAIGMGQRAYMFRTAMHDAGDGV